MRDTSCNVFSIIDKQQYYYEPLNFKTYPKIYSNDDTINKECIDFLIEHIIHCLTHINFDIFKNETFIYDLETISKREIDEFWSMNQLEDISNYNQLIEYCIHKVCMKYPQRSIGNKQSWMNFNDTNTNVDTNRIDIQLKYLHDVNKTCSKQGTQGWYKERYNYISASSAWKILEHEKLRNAYIHQRCQPMKIISNHGLYDYKHINPLQKGHRYEHVSIQIYEHFTQSKIKDYGCIPHKYLDYIASSPDGINVLPGHERYGRLLEIKNVSTRKITGIPKKEYWIQMQIQMEVCNLDGCDFLECDFREYQTKEEFIFDCNDCLFQTKQGQPKGMISIVQDDEGTYHHRYPPFPIQSFKEYERWITTLDMTFVDTIYWYLNDMSCVYVPRNKVWFRSNYKRFKDTWEQILELRNNKDRNSLLLVDMNYV